MALTKRNYLPRSTIDYAFGRVIYLIAEERGISFGQALEVAALTPGLFTEKMKLLSDESPWFENDLTEFLDGKHLDGVSTHTK